MAEWVWSCLGSKAVAFKDEVKRNKPLRITPFELKSLYTSPTPKHDDKNQQNSNNHEQSFFCLYFAIACFVEKPCFLSPNMTTTESKEINNGKSANHVNSGTAGVEVGIEVGDTFGREESERTEIKEPELTTNISPLPES